MILILGGTSEARRLAEALDRAGARFVLSLAGRTTTPLVVGEARMAGFGGVDGLHAYLRANDVAVVVDATHPFAAGMSRNAAEACALAGVRLVRLDRPGWAGHPLAASWAWVADHDEAARAAVAHGASRILLTVGRQHTLDYSPALDDRYVLARVTEAPDRELPARWELLQARGPFELADERELFARHAIDCLSLIHI